MLAATSGAGLKDLMARMGQVRAAMIYQHAVSGADKAITDAIDKNIGRARDEGEDGSAGGLVPWANCTPIARKIEKAARNDLRALLAEGKSIWAVTDTRDALILRQDRTVTEAAHSASVAARTALRDTAASRLESAWHAAYALNSARAWYWCAPTSS